MGPRSGHEANIPFNVVWHPTFVEVVKVTSEFQTYYKPSSYYGLRTNLLKKSKMDVSKQITKRMWNSIHTYGLTNCSNGWNNVAQHPLLNVMFACPNGDVFLGSIDTIGEWQDAHYICNTLVRYIETIGINNIVQICTNNVSSMKNVADLLFVIFQVFIFEVVLFIF